MIRVVTKTRLPTRRIAVRAAGGRVADRAAGGGIANRAAVGHSTESEKADALRLPISRWYFCPLARRFAARFVATPIRPWHLTAAGLVVAISAMVVLYFGAEFAPLAAVLVWLTWFFDLADGSLARQQRTASARGAWMDANADEFIDIGLHVAVAYAAAAASSPTTAWACLVAFIGGKYLFMYGLTVEEQLVREAGGAQGPPSHRNRPPSRWRRLYHLPANVDVRIHVLLIALATGWLTAGLAFVAVYYNVRWLVRWFLVLRRLEASTA